MRHRIRTAMLEADQASIYTIHSFCMRALQENAFAADAGFDVELTADVGALVEELVMDFLREVHLNLPVPPPDRAKLSVLKQRALKLTGMLRIQHPHVGGLATLGAAPQQCARRLMAFAGQQDAIVREFLSLGGKLKATLYKADFFDQFETLLDQLLQDPLTVHRNDLHKLSAATIVGALKKAHQGTELKSDFFAACSALEAAQDAFEPAFLRCFDTWFIESFQQLKRDRGLMSYDDMIVDLDRALRSSERLSAQLKRRYQAALVDEFQDTDSRQYSIFKRLFGGGSTENRYFAMIGDPKQAIYGFRGADIKAYLGARADADVRYTLPMNFRSVAEVVDGANAFFKSTDLGSASGTGGDDSIRFEAVSAKINPQNACISQGICMWSVSTSVPSHFPATTRSARLWSKARTWLPTMWSAYWSCPVKGVCISNPTKRGSSSAVRCKRVTLPSW